MPAFAHFRHLASGLEPDPSLWWQCGLGDVGPVAVASREPFKIGPSPLTNSFDTNFVLHYRLRVEGPEMQDDTSVISLNGLPPGTIMTNTITLAPGAITALDLNGQFVSDDPDRRYTIWIDGKMDDSDMYTPAAHFDVTQVIPSVLGITFENQDGPPQPAVAWSGSGFLQSASAPTGPWTDIPGASNPHPIPTNSVGFYRLRQ